MPPEEDLPSNVVRFEQLMYGSLSIGVLIAALQFPHRQSLARLASVLFIQVLIFALVVVLIWLIARHRTNWARWALLAAFLLGLTSYAPNAAGMLRLDPLAVGLNLIQFALQLAALFLVFTGDAVDWFKNAPT